MWSRMGLNTSVIPPPLFLKLHWSPNYSEFTHLRHQTTMTVTSPSLPHYVPAPRTTAECTLSFPIILDRWWWPTVFFHSGVCRSDGHRSFKGEYSRRSCWACYSSPRWHAWTRVYLCHQPWNNPRTGDLGFLTLYLRMSHWMPVPEEWSNFWYCRYTVHPSRWRGEENLCWEDSWGGFLPGI